MVGLAEDTGADGEDFLLDGAGGGVVFAVVGDFAKDAHGRGGGEAVGAAEVADDGEGAGAELEGEGHEVGAVGVLGWSAGLVLVGFGEVEELKGAVYVFFCGGEAADGGFLEKGGVVVVASGVEVGGELAEGEAVLGGVGGGLDDDASLEGFGEGVAPVAAEEVGELEGSDGCGVGSEGVGLGEYGSLAVGVAGVYVWTEGVVGASRLGSGRCRLRGLVGVARWGRRSGGGSVGGCRRRVGLVFRILDLDVDGRPNPGRRGGNAR